MASVNRVILMGHLGVDPEIVPLKSGDGVIAKLVHGFVIKGLDKQKDSNPVAVQPVAKQQTAKQGQSLIARWATMSEEGVTSMLTLDNYKDKIASISDAGKLESNPRFKAIAEGMGMYNQLMGIKEKASESAKEDATIENDIDDLPF